MIQITNSTSLKAFRWATVFIFLCNFSLAQKQFSLTVQFPTSISIKKIRAFNGDRIIGVKDKRINLKNNSVRLSGTYFTRYAFIVMFYGNDMKGAAYYVSDKPAAVTFYKSNGTHWWSKSKTVNAIDFHIWDNQFRKFAAAEVNDFERFTAPYEYSEIPDSLQPLWDKKYRQLLMKKLEFIKSYPGAYYSLRVFREEIAGADIFPKDSMINFFTTIFPDSLRYSYDGLEIQNMLEGGVVKVNDRPHDFKAKDYLGNDITLSKLKGKYVLLNFWATWCGPCMEEMPIIKEIHDKVPASKLNIIGISVNDNSTRFVKTIKKLHLDWTHIFDNIQIVEKYHISGIPELYLIDPEGIIIYSKDKEKDGDPELKTLKKILAVR